MLSGLLSVLLCLGAYSTVTWAQHVLNVGEGDICKEAGGEVWTCKSIRDCPKAIQDLQVKKRPQLCRFSSSRPVVCCEPLPKKTPPSERGVKAKQKCKEYGKHVYIKTEDSHGTFYLDTCPIVEPLVVKGKNAEVMEYPHMALIGYGEKNDINWLCGGSLISERYILSAAHCTDSGFKGKARWVRLGEYNVSSTVDDRLGLAQSTEYEIVERIDHPDYKSPSVYNDITLYKLDRNVEFNEYIRPACLHTEDEFLKEYAIATGWGLVEWRGNGSDVLQKVNLTMSSAQQCRADYRGASGGERLRNGILDRSMFCAGDTLNGGDTCQGDSGGPLQQPIEEPHCMYSQIGITSFGARCSGNKPGVYTRVSYFVPWIESIVWP